MTSFYGYPAIVDLLSDSPNNDIIPFFRNHNIEEIGWRDIQAFYDLFWNKARQTVHKRKVVLSQILQIAVDDGIILVNPIRNQNLTHSTIVHERAVPSVDEYRRIVAEIPKGRL